MRLPAASGPQALALTAGDLIEVAAPLDLIVPRCAVRVTVHRRGGASAELVTIAAIETALEIEMLRAGGIMPLILRNALDEKRDEAAHPGDAVTAA